MSIFLFRKTIKSFVSNETLFLEFLATDLKKKMPIPTIRTTSIRFPQSITSCKFSVKSLSGIFISIFPGFYLRNVCGFVIGIYLRISVTYTLHSSTPFHSRCIRLDIFIPSFVYIFLQAYAHSTTLSLLPSFFLLLIRPPLLKVFLSRYTAVLMEINPALSRSISLLRLQQANREKEMP